MPKRFLLSGKTKQPERRNQVVVNLIDNTINHPSMDKIHKDGQQKGHGGNRIYFRMLVNGYKRFGKSGFLRIRRQVRSVKKK